MKTAKVSSLVLDFEIYPRTDVNSTNVSQIVEATVSGVEMPPVLIDRKSRRVIDGFHRCKAATRINGDDAEVGIIERSFKNDSEMLLEAIRLNSSHGYKLDSCDRTRCVILAAKLQITDSALGQALNVTTDRLAKLRNTRICPNGKLSVPIKTTIKHMAGQTLTARQKQANDRLSGMGQTFYVNQLIELFEADLIDWTNDQFIARIETLRALIEGALVLRN